MPLSQDFADDAINYIKGTNFPAAPATVYVALFNGDPAGAGTEITNTIKGTTTRDAIALGAISTSGSYRQASNTGEITITASASAGATADYVALFDAATAGNRLANEALTTSKTITTGDEVKFEVGALVFRVKIA